MADQRLFLTINLVLQQIFDTDQVFGGKSILLVGDTNQLSPVAGNPLFKLPTSIHLSRVQENPHLFSHLPHILQQPNRLISAEKENVILMAHRLYSQFKLVFILRQIMRQTDSRLIEFLDNISKGKILRTDFQYISPLMGDSPTRSSIGIFANIEDADWMNTSF